LVITDNIFTRKSGYYAWPQFRILGVLAAIYGIYTLFTNGLTLFGLEFILIVAGILINLFTSGIQLEFSKNLYREYTSLLGLRFGKWINLPKIDYVTVHQNQIVKRGGVQSIDYQSRDKVLQVSLIVSEFKKYEVGIFFTKEQAIEIGKLCADNLKTRLLDYTGREPKWVKLTK